MGAKDLQELTINELEDKLRKEREALFKLRFRSATGKLSNPLKLRIGRREIARLLTVIGMKGKSARAGK